MNSFLKICVLCFLIVVGCTNSPPKDAVIITSKPRLLQDIIKSDTLRAITTYSGTTYFLYRGQPMGFEYEILQRFAEHLDLHLEMVIAKDENKLVEMLNQNEGDLIAYGYTITKERQKMIDFSDPLYISHQVLVQQKPKNWRNLKLHQIKERIITNPIQLINDSVSVKKNSSYYQRLQNLNNEVGGVIHIESIPGNMTTDEIFENISSGAIRYTIADQNIASIYASDYPNIDISTKMSFSQRIGWGFRKNTKKLQDTLNQWLKREKKTLDYKVIYNKYFKNKSSFRRRAKSEFFSINEKKISPYDDIFVKYANQIGWDWRLLAAIAFQESKFQSTDESWAGARGIMQIMPNTAEELNITDPTDPEQSIRGATKYISQLFGYFDKVTDTIQRQKFTLASYNAGLGHILDAQRMAEHLNLNPLLWDANVELALLKLDKPEYYRMDMIKYGYVRAKQPYYYVRDIFEGYNHYKAFFEEDFEK